MIKTFNEGLFYFDYRKEFMAFEAFRLQSRDWDSYF